MRVSPSGLPLPGWLAVVPCRAMPTAPGPGEWPGARDRRDVELVTSLIGHIITSRHYLHVISPSRVADPMVVAMRSSLPGEEQTRSWDFFKWYGNP